MTKNLYNIRQQVAWLTLIPLLIMAVCLEAFFLHSRFSDLDQGLLERGKLIARQLASSSEYGVFSDNRVFLQNIANGALQQTDVRGLLILNAASETLVEAGEFTNSSKNTGSDANPTRSLSPAKRTNTGENNNCHGSSNTMNKSDKKNALAIWFIPPSRPISDTFSANKIVRQ